MKEKKLKASVITLHTVDNYGSALQTYATQQVLKKLGYDVEFVDYWRKDNLPEYRAAKMLESFTMQKLKPIWGLNAYTKNLTLTLLEKHLAKKKSPMRSFIEEHVALTPQRYYSLEELKIIPPSADVYITGSDQVWNSIWNQGIDRAYFLDYAPHGKPRIAFSASIGRETLDPQEVLETQALLKAYRAISVREKSAVDLLASLGIASVSILDPTLMLNADEWRKLSSKTAYRKPYLLVYQLNQNSQMDEYGVQLAKKEGWELVRIGFGRSDHKKSGKCIMMPSVADFLSLFCQAACVLTDSFHATAFSLNLGTAFISVLPSRFGTRIQSILELTGTTNRMLRDFQDFNIINVAIDTEKVHSILEKERAWGTQFLRSALQEEG